MQLMVNGTVHEVDVEEDMPLLWVLREVIGHKGTKYGCGIAACGACTVMVEGEAVRSSQTLAGDLEETEITSRGWGAPKRCMPSRRPGSTIR